MATLQKSFGHSRSKDTDSGGLRTRVNSVGKESRSLATMLFLQLALSYSTLKDKTRPGLTFPNRPLSFKRDKQINTDSVGLYD